MGVDTAKKISGTTYDAHKSIVDTPANDRFIQWEGQDVDRFKGADTVYNSLIYPKEDSLKSYTDEGFLGALNKRAEELKGFGKIDGRPEFSVVETGRVEGQKIADELLKDPNLRQQMKIDTKGPVTTWEVLSKLGPEDQDYVEQQIWNSKGVQDAVQMDAYAGVNTQDPEYKEKKLADIREMIRMSSVESGQYKADTQEGGAGRGGGNDQWAWDLIESKLKTLPDEGGSTYVTDKPLKVFSLSRIDQGENKPALIPDSRLSAKEASVYGTPLRVKEKTSGKWVLEIEEMVPIQAKNKDGSLKTENGNPVYETLSDGKTKYVYKTSELPYNDEVASKIYTHTTGKKGGGFDLKEALGGAAKPVVKVEGTPNPSTWVKDSQYQVGDAVYYYDETAQIWKKK
jgi:hypothetical protein